MAKARFFNKGILKGVVSKSDLIDFDGKAGKSKFLSIEVSTGGSNRVKAVVFPTKANPKKAIEWKEQYPVNTQVEISGNIKESEFENKTTHKKGIDRSVSAMSIRPLPSDAKHNATFLLQGNAIKIKEISDGVEITVETIEEYEDKDGKKVQKNETFTLIGDNSVIDLIRDIDLNKDCNAKFKGLILNKLEFDDYGDVVGSVQKFQVEKIEEVVQKDEIETEEELGFI